MIGRGDVWWADLGEPRGSAPALYRPVVIVSADSFNASRLKTVTVAAITRTLKLGALPGNIVLPAATSGLEYDSVINVTQLATLDRLVLDQRVGSLPAWLLEKLDEGLALALDLA
jgi:mRNA interferase MazF